MEEGRGKKLTFPGSEGPRVPESKGPRYLKVIFKYELDSKEGPSCSIMYVFYNNENCLVDKDISFNILKYI